MRDYSTRGTYLGLKRRDLFRLFMDKKQNMDERIKITQG